MLSSLIACNTYGLSVAGGDPMYACHTVSIQDDCTVCQTSHVAEHCVFIKIWAVQESEGNILDDEVLINTLNNSKLTAGKQNLLLCLAMMILHMSYASSCTGLIVLG